MIITIGFLFWMIVLSFLSHVPHYFRYRYGTFNSEIRHIAHIPVSIAYSFEVTTFGKRIDITVPKEYLHKRIPFVNNCNILEFDVVFSTFRAF